MIQTTTLVVFNPLPQRARGKRLQALCRALEAAQRPYTLIATDADLHKTAKIIQQQLSGVGNLVVVGGDGTLHQVVNALAEVQLPPTLALVPAGTGNDFARSWFGPNQAVETIIYRAVNGKAEAIDVGCVNGRYFINSVGVGFDGDLTQHLAGQKSYWPKLTYMLNALRQLFRYRGKPLVFCHVPEGSPLSKRQPSLLFVAANTPFFGAGMQIAPHAQHNSGSLAWVHIKECNLTTKLLSFASIYKGMHLQNSVVTHGQLRRVHIQTAGVAMQADGEFIGCTPADIKSHSGLLTMRR